MNVKERILIFISERGLKKSEFERLGGLSNGYLNNFKGSLGDEKLNNILTAFPELNKIWLLTGEGEMLKSSSQIIGNVDARGNRGFAGNMSGGNYTIHHDEGKDKMIDEQKKEVDKMFEAIIVAVNGFQKASERHDDYVVRQDDYIKRQDEYIARIINNSYQRNRENMERIDALLAAMNEDRQKSREQLDRVLTMLENKLGL